MRVKDPARDVGRVERERHRLGEGGSPCEKNGKEEGEKDHDASHSVSLLN